MLIITDLIEDTEKSQFLKFPLFFKAHELLSKNISLL